MKLHAKPLFNPAARMLSAVLLLAAVAGCSKKEEVVAPTISNEALTTVTLHLVNNGDASNVVTAQWEELLDNKGQPLPVDVSQASLTLRAGATYTGQLGVLDKSQTPTFDVGKEIAETRTTYHHFFYQPLPSTSPFVIPAPMGAETYPSPIPTPLPASSALNLTITTTDFDTNKNPLPLGLQTRFVAGAAGTGYLRLVLRHQPNTKDGTYAPGSTDLDVGFNVTIQ